MKIILPYLIILCLLPVIPTEKVHAQNENDPISVQDSSKKIKRIRKERERPERTLIVRKATIPVDKKKKTTGNWKDYAVAFDESGNKGASKNNPIMIESAGHLAYLATRVNSGNNYAGKHFRLSADINLDTREWTPIGQFGKDRNDNSRLFCGYFYGEGHKAENVTVTKGTDYQGLFGICGPGAYIEKLGLTDCFIKAESVVGGIAGELREGVIIECYVTGDVIATKEVVGGLAGINNGMISGSYASVSVFSTGNDVGGLIGINGDNMPGKLQNCYATGTVNGYWNVGGLIGRNAGNVESCRASGNVFGREWAGGLVGWADEGIITDSKAAGNVKGYFDIGGLIGFNGYYGSTARIENCYATGTITGSGSGNYCIGGLAGYSGGVISDCSASGEVNGEESVGGLVGEHSGILTDCHATGKVSGSFDVGGLIGFNGYPGGRTAVEGCYATGTVVGYRVFNYGIGGLVGSSGGSITKCYATGSVSGEESVGGLAGEQEGVISDSYAVGSVEGKICAGGLVGWNWAKLKSCYAAGAVKSEGNSGGLIGQNKDTDAVVDFCYFDVQNTKQNTGIGFDNNKQGTAVISKTTAELTEPALPEGFDSRVWQTVNGNYPKLKIFSEGPRTRSVE